MSQVTDQILTDEESAIQAQIQHLHEQKNANILVRFQGALQGARDRKYALDSEISELENEVNGRTPAHSEEQAQG